MVEFKVDEKTSTVDDRGRITIPVEFKKLFPPKTEVKWRMRGDKLLVSFGEGSPIEFLTDEYLMNQILDMSDELNSVKSSIKCLRDALFKKFSRDSVREMELKQMISEYDEVVKPEMGIPTGDSTIIEDTKT